MVTAIWLSRLAARYHIAHPWLIVGIAQLAVVGGSFVSQVVLSDLPNQSHLSMGFYGISLFASLPWSQFAQVLAPLAVAWLVFARSTQRAEAIG